jgi:3-isopropylmalate dehydratase small subunit
MYVKETCDSLGLHTVKGQKSSLGAQTGYEINSQASLLLFLNSVFPKKQTNAKLFVCRQNFARGSTRSHALWTWNQS